MKSKLPKTETVTYERKSRMINVGKKQIDWANPSPFQEDNSKVNLKGYRVPCQGDSGAGHVAYMSIDKNPIESHKYVLAAIHTAEQASNIKDGGIHVGMPCGSYVQNRDSTTGGKHILQAQGEAQSTSWPEILDWIKTKAKINKL